MASLAKRGQGRLSTRATRLRTMPTSRPGDKAFVSVFTQSYPSEPTVILFGNGVFGDVRTDDLFSRLQRYRSGRP
jgi:hypothetical protein